jgi:hypothetical protein
VAGSLYQRRAHAIHDRDACFSAKRTCSSVNFDFFIASSLGERWAARLRQRCHPNVVAVAMAKKNARIIE